MAKCSGVKENGTDCRSSTMYKSDYCKKHQTQDPSIIICMGTQHSGRTCIREAMKGELFCRGHLTQKGDIEKLQCPRGCGQLTFRLWNQSGYYHCDECKGAMLDAKRLETKLAEDLADKFNHLLETEGEECSLRCPSCEGLMLEFKIVYVMPEGGGGGIGNIGSIDHPGAIVGILAIVVVVAVVAAVVDSAKKKEDDEENEFSGPVMVIDGCKDCGTFWFDANELKVVRQSTSIRGADEGEGEKPGTVANPDWKGATETNLAETIVARTEKTNCLYIDVRNGKKCRRVTYRGTENCYMHQTK